MVSPVPPLISPSSINCVMAPSRAWSTAPVAPPGCFTPRKMLTTNARVSMPVISPDSTLISSALVSAALVETLALDALGFGVVVIAVMHLPLIFDCSGRRTGPS